MHSNQHSIPDSREFQIELTSDYIVDDFNIKAILFTKNTNVISFMPLQVAMFLTNLMKEKYNVQI